MATGNQIVKELRKHKGKVYIPAAFGPYIYVVKSDLIRYFEQQGDKETGCEFHNDNGNAFVD